MTTTTRGAIGRALSEAGPGARGPGPLCRLPTARGAPSVPSTTSTCSLGRGEIVGIVGESGCGKSVTAMSLAGLLPRSANVTGSVRLQGEELVGASAARLRAARGKDIAYIFQEPMTSLNPVLTVGRQIGEVLEVHEGLSRASGQSRAVELLSLVGIPSARERVGQYPHQLSGGMRQRVMIAMAIACEPRVLVADEPTTALDVTVQAGILDVLRELRDRLGHEHPRHHPRPRRHRRRGRPGRRDVCRSGRRGGARPRALRPSAAPLHRRACSRRHPRRDGTPGRTGCGRSPASCRPCASSPTPAPSRTAAPPRTTAAAAVSLRSRSCRGWGPVTGSRAGTPGVSGPHRRRRMANDHERTDDRRRGDGQPASPTPRCSSWRTSSCTSGRSAPWTVCP